MSPMPMTLEIEFRKEKAEKWLASLEAQQSIEGVQTMSDAIVLAGVCFHFAYRQDAWSAGVARRPFEQREAALDVASQQIQKAILFFSYLVSRVDIGDYDDGWEAVVRAIVKYNDTAEELLVEPISGYRG